MSKVSEQRIREAAEELVNYRWGNATVSQASAAGLDMREWQLGGTRLMRAAKKAVDRTKSSQQSTSQQQRFQMNERDDDSPAPPSSPKNVAQKAVEKQQSSDYKANAAESLKEMQQLRNGSDSEKNDYSARVGGATDRVEALVKANFDSPQWKNSSDYQYRTISEASAKLAYSGDLQSTPRDKIANFNRNGILLVASAYQNNVSDEAKKQWAQEFVRLGKPNDFKLEQFAAKSAVHAEIAKDLRSRI